MKQIFEQANVFKKHEVIKKARHQSDGVDMEYILFKRPSTVTYGFSVTIHNNSLTLTGDIGFAAIVNIPGIRGWLNTTLRNPMTLDVVDWRYLRSKAPNDLVTTEYREERALEELREIYEGNKDNPGDPFTEDLYDRMQSRLRDGSDYLAEVNDEIGRWDYINGKDTSSGFIWAMMGLRALLRYMEDKGIQ